MSAQRTPGPWTFEDTGSHPGDGPMSLPHYKVTRYWENDTTGMVGTGIVTGGADTFAYLRIREPDAEFMERACNAFDTMWEALLNAEAVMSIVPPRNSMKEYVACLHQIRAAIAAARGETP